MPKATLPLSPACPEGNSEPWTTHAEFRLAPQNQPTPSARLISSLVCEASTTTATWSTWSCSKITTFWRVRVVVAHGAQRDETATKSIRRQKPERPAMNPAGLARGPWEGVSWLSQSQANRLRVTLPALPFASIIPPHRGYSTDEDPRSSASAEPPCAGVTEFVPSQSTVLPLLQPARLLDERTHFTSGRKTPANLCTTTPS